MSEPKYLGKTTPGSITSADLDLWPVPEGVRKVTLSTAELQAVCPVTGQPDVYEAAITYEPVDWIVESKAMKMWLTSFRDQGISAEALATTIAQLLAARLDCPVHVVTRQGVRGGISITTEATA